MTFPLRGAIWGRLVGSGIASPTTNRPVGTDRPAGVLWAVGIGLLASAILATLLFVTWHRRRPDVDAPPGCGIRVGAS